MARRLRSLQPQTPEAAEAQYPSTPSWHRARAPSVMSLGQTHELDANVTPFSNYPFIPSKPRSRTGPDVSRRCVQQATEELDAAESRRRHAAFRRRIEAPRCVSCRTFIRPSSPLLSFALDAMKACACHPTTRVACGGASSGTAASFKATVGGRSARADRSPVGARSLESARTTSHRASEVASPVRGA